jgi:hypothetical protein
MVVEYPITGPEISNFIKDMGLEEECFRVRGSSEPSEIDQLSLDDDVKGKSILTDPYYTESAKVSHKDYFGNEFNKSFLKDLEKSLKERRKELGHDKGDPNVLEAAPKIKQDKAGVKSAMGS